MKNILGTVFSFLIISNNSYAVDTLANCKLNLDENGETLSSYSVLRDGDRMFGRYRLTEGRDYEETDDIFLKKYEEEDLAKLRENGLLQIISDRLKIDEDKIEKVVFFGIVEVEDEDDSDVPPEEFTKSEEDPPAPAPVPPVYLMEIYKVTGGLGVNLGSVGKPFENDYLKCNNNSSRFFL